MSKKIIIPLAVSIILNCVLGYNLHLTQTDLKNSEEVNRLHTKEIQKLNQQIEAAAIPEGFEIEHTPDKKTARRIMPYIPPRSAEPYIPVQGNWASNQPAYYQPENINIPSPTYNTPVTDAARALNNIDVDLTLDSMFQRPYIIYPYPNY